MLLRREENPDLKHSAELFNRFIGQQKKKGINKGCKDVYIKYPSV
jgi:hypothetical protein